MASMDVMRQKNMESSMLFMQQEHARTLKDLHEEIQKLQKRCSELTFQLAMETTSTSQEDFYREKSEKLEEEGVKKDTHISTLEEELESKVKRIRFLEDQLKALDMKMVNDMRAKDMRIRELSHELDQKATLIAALNHKIMSRSHEAAYTRALRDDRSDSDERASSESGSSPRTPQPPKEGAPTRQRRPTKLRKSPPPQLLQGTVIPRPPSGRKLPMNPYMQDDALPDPAPFLHQRESSDLVRQSSLVPLPPIKTIGGKPEGALRSPPFTKSNSVNNMTVGFIKKKFRQNRQREVSPSGESSPEVEVLAVDQFKTGDGSVPYHKTDCN